MPVREARAASCAVAPRDQLAVDGHAPQRHSGGGVDCIPQRREGGGCPGLADAAGRLLTLDHVDIDRWCLIDAQHPVVVEIRLAHATFLQRDLSPECCRQPKDMTSLQLRHDGVRIHGDPGVDGCGDAAQLHIARLTYLALHDARNEARKRDLRRDPASAMRRQWFTPARFLAYEIERCLQAWSLVEMCVAKGDRIFSRLVGKLIDEALDGEHVVVGADATPKPRVDSW